MALPIGQAAPLPIEAAQIQRAQASSAAGTSATGEASSLFADKLNELVQDTNAMQTKAQDSADAYARGQNNDLHGTMIDAAQADVSLRLLANVRNRVIDAYREVMRMGS